MRAYRWLLRLYPSDFRAAYGRQMEAVFEAKRQAAAGAGFAPVAGLWLEAFADVMRHALPLHLEVVRMDVRYALRSLGRAPGFAITAVVIAGLGIGATTAVFTVADRVLLRPLAFPEPERLVRVWESPPGYAQMEVSPPNYRDWRGMARSFEGMAAYDRRSANLAGVDEPVRIQGSGVAWELFRLLRVTPLLGRSFTAEDDRPGTAGTLILSHGLWQRSFGGAADIVGRTIVLDDEPYTVIGVMPPEFRFPFQQTEYWASLRLDAADEDRNNNYLEVAARLNPGVSLEQARAEMLSVMARLVDAHPAENEGKRATVNRIADELPGQARPLLFALLGAAACMLLIACTNLASLMLARAMARRHELAVRSSLGAGPRRLVRQLLTESLVLAILGGLVGLAIARAGLPLLATLVPTSLPLADAPALDIRILGFAMALTVVTGLAFGVLPARRAGRSSFVGDLRDGGTRGGAGRRERARAVLVITEVTASVVLLILTGLLVRALVRVEATDPGFRAEGVLTARTWLPWPRYAPVDARAAFYDRVLADVNALPGVEAAAYTSFLPIVMGGGIWPVELEERAGVRSAASTASLRFITSDYFKTLDIPVLRGRGITDADIGAEPFVAVVSQSFAERFWPDRDPIGRTFGFAFFQRTVVGVVGDVRVRGLERQSEPQVYLPHRQTPDSSLIFYAPKDLAIRVDGDPLRIVPAVREIVRAADPTQPVTAVRLMEEIVAGDTMVRRAQLRVLAIFAGLALLLAAIGIHGLLSFTARSRAHEIGIRLALGARRRGILAMVVREGLVLGATGVAAGALVGLAAGRGVQSLLAGVPPADLVTLGSAVAVGLVVTVMGSLLPAIRAARTDANTLLHDG